MAKKNDNPNRVQLSTPKGVLNWPHLTAPDYGTDKFPKEDGEYNACLLLDASDAKTKAFTDRLDEMMKVAKELAQEEFDKLPIKARKTIESNGGIRPNEPYAEVYDEDTEQPTGELEFRAKMKAGGIRKKDNKPWSAKPALFDAKGKPLPKHVEVWGGSTAILNCTLEPYFVAGTGAYGLQKRLNAAQILDLVAAGGNRSASSYGFEAQEGFDGDDIEEPEDETSADAEADDDEVDDANF